MRMPAFFSFCGARSGKVGRIGHVERWQKGLLDRSCLNEAVYERENQPPRSSGSAHAPAALTA